MVHYRVYVTQALNTILSQLYPTHDLTLYFFKTYVLILSSQLGLRLQRCAFQIFCLKLLMQFSSCHVFCAPF